ncbi:MAG: hypothetical protein ACKVZ0_08860 [Gemmatimonadales bacterium]
MLYFSPETVLPIASVAAAAVGAVLLFFRRGLALWKALLARMFRRSPPPSSS